MSQTVRIPLTMYGVAEVIKWCVDKNQGRIPGVDTQGFKTMQALLAQKPQSNDYLTLDQFWKKQVRSGTHDRRGRDNRPLPL